MSRKLVTRRRDIYMPDYPMEIRCPIGRSHRQHEHSVEQTLDRLLVEQAEKQAELNKRVWQKIQEEVKKS